MSFGNIYVVFYVIIGVLLHLFFEVCQGQVYGSYLDVSPRRVFEFYGHKMCMKSCKKSGLTLCKSYNFDRSAWTCSLNADDTNTATLAQGNNYLYQEISDISDDYAGACKAHSCGNNERCVVLHGKRPKCMLSECGDPPTVLNAAVDPGVKAVKTIRSYSCDTGYVLSGDGNITCKAKGQWTEPTFSCQLVDCGTPPTANNADVSQGSTTYGATKTYTCHSGYDTSGTTTITCQVDGSWTAVGITCSIQACTAPPTPPNTNAPSYSSTNFQSVVTYTCVTGYTMNGGSLGVGDISCEAGPAWSSVDFTCNIQDCGAPTEAVTNAGSPSYSTTTYQSTASYTCDAGYSLSDGVGRITCQAGPSWESVSFTCDIQVCAAPPTTHPNTNAPSYSSTNYGSAATYTCVTGYTMSGGVAGVGTITCDPGPVWSSFSFSCVIQDCGAPQGTVTNAGSPSYSSTTYQSVATYTCETGYIPSDGVGQITCQAGPSWESISFTCDIQDCGVPPTLTSGSRSFSTTTYGSTATYSCTTGYTLSAGTNPITCQSSGSWETMGLSCGSVDCGSPPTLTSGSRSFSTTTYGSTATYSCNTGYTLSAGTNPITCQSSGSWETMGLSCTIVDCGSPPTLTTGSRSFSTTTYGSTATYSCNTGYTLSAGTNPITCQSSGSWQTMGLSCSIVDCGSPPTLTSGSRSFSSTTYGRTATYSCNTGYTLSAGTNPITCQSSGSWETMGLSCSIVDCGSPPTLTSGSRSFSTTTYGSTATYSCTTGYTMSAGTNPITCQSSGSWTTMGLSCSIVDCGSPPTLTSGSRSFSTTTYGSTATYSCTTGYTLSAGTNPITCQSSGSWQTMGLSCVVVDCGVPPTLSNGARTYPGTTYNKIATYTCNSGYSMDIGTNTITCQSTGSWNTITFSCVASGGSLTACSASAGSGYSYGGRCYVMSSDTKTWSDAVSQCQSYSMHLVDVTSSGESAHVKAVVQAAPANMWIGGSDTATEGSWVWAYTGAAFSYLDWWPSDPDGGTGQNCLGIWGASYESKWIDIGCSSALKYMCESN